MSAPASLFNANVAAVQQTAPISVVVLTKNEELNLPQCLASVHGWCAEIFVVDSGSTDATLEIAASYGATVVQHAFEGHTRQWNWAFANLQFAQSWALCLDADQRISPELRDEIIRKTTKPPHEGGFAADVCGAYLRRLQIFRGKPITHGGYRRKPLLKLLRPQMASCDERELMDSRFYVAGPSLVLRGALIEDNRKEYDISFWIAKHTRYAALQAREEFQRTQWDAAHAGPESAEWKIKPSLFGTPDQRSLWLRSMWYRHAPLYVRPFLYFFYRYFLQLGFLDGGQGFIF